VWAVVPVKAFGRGKSRLGEVLTDPLRTAFARGLFEHVVGVLRAAPMIAGVLVVTDDDDVATRARELGLSVERDPAQAKLAQVVDAGMAAVRARGGSAALVCMADLPHLTVADVEQVVAALNDHAVVLAPDLHELGTNVLCVGPAGAFPSCFGQHDSFAQHLAKAHAHGLSTRVLSLRGLCFDVDGPADLAQLGDGAAQLSD
jgi:2-phospho-L-lactate guanylyltransferase